jgi:hypothetical protein
MVYVRKPKSKAVIAIDRALGRKESTPRGPRIQKPPVKSRVHKPPAKPKPKAARR